MKRERLKILILTLFVTFLFVLPVWSEDSGKAFDMGMSMVIGTQSFVENGATVTYQTLSFHPDIAFGKVGIGLDVTLHYNFTGGPDSNQFHIREADWIPSEPVTFSKVLGLYLPLIRYVRYGEKGDPIYAKFGAIDDATLGNGFIMSNYSNTQYLPEKKIFGLSFDLDGRLFNFPYVGFESVIGNLSLFDVVGVRLFARPLLFLNIPIIKNIEFGTTYATDTDVYAFENEQTGGSEKGSVYAYGMDFRLPILSNPVVSLATFGDIASIESKSVGGMLGFGGRLISIFTYGAQLRMLGENFIPSYFDQTYDLYRTVKYQLVETTNAIPGYVGWFASAGTSLLDDSIIFNVSLDGPFGTVSSDTDSFVNYPHLVGMFIIKDNLLKGFSFDASYDKKLIKSFRDLISPEDAVIQARLNYKTGPAMISFVYKIRYVANPGPGENPWQVTSGLESSIQLF